MFKTDRKFYWIISMSGFHDVEHSLINVEMIDLKQVYSLQIERTLRESTSL